MCSSTNQARLNFADSNRLARDNKLAQWQAYQALSDEEKRKLAARAAPKPQGAATALKPVSPRKLAQIPAASEANPNRPNQPKIPVVQSLSPRLAKPALPAPAAAGHGSDAPVFAPSSRGGDGPRQRTGSCAKLAPATAGCTRSQRPCDHPGRARCAPPDSPVICMSARPRLKRCLPRPPPPPPPTFRPPA